MWGEKEEETLKNECSAFHRKADSIRPCVWAVLFFTGAKTNSSCFRASLALSSINDLDHHLSRPANNRNLANSINIKCWHRHAEKKISFGKRKPTLGRVHRIKVSISTRAMRCARRRRWIEKKQQSWRGKEAKFEFFIKFDGAGEWEKKWQIIMRLQ